VYLISKLKFVENKRFKKYANLNVKENQGNDPSLVLFDKNNRIIKRLSYNDWPKNNNVDQFFDEILSDKNFDGQRVKIN
jgi:hypothetical protein